MKKRIIILAAVMVLTLIASIVFAACGDTNGGKKSESGTYNLKVWCAEEDREMIENMLYEYEQLKENKNNKYNWTVQPVGEKDAGTRVIADPSVSADVFSFASDQLGKLVTNNAILSVPSVYHDQLDEQIVVAQNAATFDNEYYAYPYTYENCFLYYNKSLLNESQVGSLETLLAATLSSGVDANIAMDMADSYYTTSFLYTAGVEIFGSDGMDASDVDINNDKAYKACKYIASLNNEKKFKSIGEADQSIALQNGKVASIISGPHKITEFKSALGSNFAVAKLPTIKFEGDSKATQLVCFNGIKLYGVNRNTKSPEEACKLAAFLSNYDNQYTRLDERSFCPTDSALFEEAKDSQIKEVEVVIEQSAYSKLKPSLMEMSAYWDAMGAFLNGVYKNAQPENAWSTELSKIENKLQEKK